MHVVHCRVWMNLPFNYVDIQKNACTKILLDCVLQCKTQRIMFHEKELQNLTEIMYKINTPL
jgi:hypothetical protein